MDIEEIVFPETSHRMKKFNGDLRVKID